MKSLFSPYFHQAKQLMELCKQLEKKNNYFQVLNYSRQCLSRHRRILKDIQKQQQIAQMLLNQQTNIHDNIKWIQNNFNSMQRRYIQKYMNDTLYTSFYDDKAISSLRSKLHSFIEKVRNSIENQYLQQISKLIKKVKIQKRIKEKYHNKILKFQKKQTDFKIIDKPKLSPNFEKKIKLIDKITNPILLNRVRNLKLKNKIN